MQRKALCQVGFDHDFPKIHWLIESKVFSIIAPHQTKKYFFSVKAKNKLVLQRFSRQFMSNSDLGEKYSENTSVFKREIRSCHSARRFYLIRKAANRKCSTKLLFWNFRENFQENIRGSIFFLILLTKTLHQGCFLCNFRKYFRTPQRGCFWNYLGKYF